MTKQENLIRVWEILGGPVRYFAKSHGKIQGGICRTPSSLIRVADNLSNWDIYVTLNPSTGLGVKASSSDITHWRRILIDIDPVAPDALPVLAAGYTVGLLENLFPNQHTTRAITVISSGRGYQLWLDVTDTAITGRSHARRIEESVSSLFHELNHSEGGCRIDPSCSDLSRVARCPGTVNQKTGALAVINSNWSANPLTPFPGSAILRAFPAEPKKESMPIPQSTRLGDILPHLTQRAANYLTEGVGSPGRHAAAYAAAASLRDMTVPEDTAMNLVSVGGRLCRPPLTADECIRATRGAYQKEKS